MDRDLATRLNEIERVSSSCCATFDLLQFEQQDCLTYRGNIEDEDTEEAGQGDGGNEMDASMMSQELTQDMSRETLSDDKERNVIENLSKVGTSLQELLRSLNKEITDPIGELMGSKENVGSCSTQQYGAYGAAQSDVSPKDVTIATAAQGVTGLARQDIQLQVENLKSGPLNVKEPLRIQHTELSQSMSTDLRATVEANTSVACGQERQEQVRRRVGDLSDTSMHGRRKKEICPSGRTPLISRCVCSCFRTQNVFVKTCMVVLALVLQEVTSEDFNVNPAGAMTKEDRELDELLVTVKTGKLERLQQLVSRMHVPIVTPQAAAPCYPYQYLTVSQVQSAVATYSASLNRCEDTSPKVRVRSSTVECVL